MFSTSVVKARGKKYIMSGLLRRAWYWLQEIIFTFQSKTDPANSFCNSPKTYSLYQRLGLQTTKKLQFVDRWVNNTKRVQVWLTFVLKNN